MRDSVGTTIHINDVIRHGQATGIVKDDDFDGYWCKLSTGKKIRLSDYKDRATVVKKKHHKAATK